MLQYSQSVTAESVFDNSLSR